MPDRRAGRSMKPFTCGLFLFCTQETRATSRSVQRFCILMSSASELPTPASASFGLFCSPPATALEEPTHRESIKDRNRIDQRRRREVVLSSQRARRAQVLAQSRGVWDGVPAPEAFDLSVEDHGESEAESESMEAVATPASATAAADEMDTGAGGSGGKRAGRSGRTRRGPGRNVAAEQLTSAEWLVDVPPDLAGSWYVTPRPAGWRCLVRTSGELTRAYGRTGGKPRAFPSALPGGSRASRGAVGACVLDCIWSDAEKTYYVLDCLVWNGHRLVDCPFEFRHFWLRQRLGADEPAPATAPATQQRSAANPCVFAPLLALPATPLNLHAAYAGSPPFAAPKDGLLFVHREALYEGGMSPLVLSWADASCSARFFDYGSDQMREQLKRRPGQAARWRAAELESAVRFSELWEAAERPPMEDALPAEGLPSAPPLSVSSTAPPVLSGVMLGAKADAEDGDDAMISE